MRPFRLVPAFLLGCTLYAGCAGPRFVVPEVAPAPPEAYGRAPDGLLDRPDLQRLVDLQVMRRGDSLTAFLAAPDAAVRARAAFALGSVQHAAAVPALVGRLGDSDARVRADAAFALGQAADSTEASALLDALRAETDATVQHELIEALGKTGGQEALRALLLLDLPAAQEAVRALALGRFGIRGVHAPEAAAWLAARLTAPDAALRENAAYYFGRVRDTAPWAAEARTVRAAFDALAPGDLARMPLTLALGRLGATPDVNRLVRALALDPDWRIRTNAARALGLGDTLAPSAPSALFAALADSVHHVSITAAGVLAGADLAPAWGAQAAAWVRANGEDWHTAGALLPALVRAGHMADALAWLEGQEAPFAVALGLGALGAAPDAASLDRLFAAAAEEDARVAYAALEALKARWEATRTGSADARRFYDAFAEGLRRRDLATAYSTAPALADSLFLPFGNGALLREVYAQMEAPLDIEPMTEIVRAVGQVRDGAEIDFLVDVVMQSDHPVLRQAAEQALNGRLLEGIDVEALGEVAPTTILMEWDQLVDLGPRPLLTLFTERGPIVIELETEQAPQTVQKLARTARRGEYDGVPFHRVVPNFVIQGGDFYRRDGFGGPDVAIRSEFTRLRYRTGTAGMASAGKDTEGVQYFVTHSPTPHLDGRYTAFGRVVAGQEIADAIRQGDFVLEATVTPTRER